MHTHTHTHALARTHMCARQHVTHHVDASIELFFCSYSIIAAAAAVVVDCCCCCCWCCIRIIFVMLILWFVYDFNLNNVYTRCKEKTITNAWVFGSISVDSIYISASLSLFTFSHHNSLYYVHCFICHYFSFSALLLYFSVYIYFGVPLIRFAIISH